MRPDVGSHVHQHVVDEGQDPAVARGRDLGLVNLLPGVVGGHHVLAAVLDPLDRPPQCDRRPRHQEVLGVELSANAEPAADIRLDEPDARLRQAEQIRQDAAVEVGDLRRSPDREHAGVAVVGGHQTAGLQRHAGVPLDREALADADIRIGQEAHGVADDRRQMFGDVSR